MSSHPPTSARAANLTRMAAAVAAAFAIAVATAVAAPERASATTLAAGASYSKTTVINKKITKNFNNLSKQLSACSVGTTGARCSSAIHSTYTNTWQTSLGLSAKALAADLGFSYAATTGYSTSCQSPAMKKGQTWRMYPRGARATYNIRKLTATQFRTTTQTSGTLTSFKADRNAIFCTIR